LFLDDLLPLSNILNDLIFLLLISTSSNKDTADCLTQQSEYRDASKLFLGSKGWLILKDVNNDVSPRYVIADVRRNEFRLLIALVIFSEVLAIIVVNLLPFNFH